MKTDQHRPLHPWRYADTGTPTPRRPTTTTNVFDKSPDWL